MISLTGMILKMRYCVCGAGRLRGRGTSVPCQGYGAWKLLGSEGASYLTKNGKQGCLRLLEHPSVPRMVDYVETWRALLSCDGVLSGVKSLGQLQRVGHVFTAEEILSYSDTVLQVLEYLHNQKPPIYYGDLKPDNLMLSETGRLYLVDFGSAVLGFGNEPRICMGTEGFAAPEQYQGKVSERSVIFLLLEKPSALWPGKTGGEFCGRFRGCGCLCIAVCSRRKKNVCKVRHRQRKCFLT